MKPNEIRAAMMLAGVSQTDIAKKLGVTRSAVSQAICGRFKSRRIQEEIAKAIGKKVEEIWPQSVA